MNKYILSDTGEPIAISDLFAWAKWIESAENRRIAYSQISDEIYVSTVFLGLDHGFDEGKPLLFETMVFGGTLDVELQRYTTIEAAKAGHENFVKQVQAADVWSEIISE